MIIIRHYITFVPSVQYVTIVNYSEAELLVEPPDENTVTLVDVFVIRRADSNRVLMLYMAINQQLNALFGILTWSMSANYSCARRIDNSLIQCTYNWFMRKLCDLIL